MLIPEKIIKNSKKVFSFLKYVIENYEALGLKIMFVGFSILAIGIILLLNNLGIISGDVWSIVWPALIIILGLRLLF